MKKDNIVNPQLIAAIASLGHTEYLCIGDCGLPTPEGVPVIDLSISAGLPRFLEVLSAVESELVIEGYLCASEIDEKNPDVLQGIQGILSGKTFTKIPHEEFKQLTQQAKYIIRTGETTPYANIILIGGVNF